MEKMRRVDGVADQDDIVEVPAPTAHDRKVAPGRTVFDQPVTVEFVGKQVLQVGDGGVLVVDGKPACGERLGGAFGNEGRVAVHVLVGVNAPQAMFALFEIEREGGERPRRAEP